MRKIAIKKRSIQLSEDIYTESEIKKKLKFLIFPI